MRNTNDEIFALAGIQLMRNHERIEEAKYTVISLSRENGHILQMVMGIDRANGSAIPGSLVTSECFSEGDQSADQSSADYLKSIGGKLVWLTAEEEQVLKDYVGLGKTCSELEAKNARPKNNGKRQALGRGLKEIEGK